MAVVGIDLGTTNTVVGVVRDGQAMTVRDADGEYLLPSVVSFHPTGGVLVGKAAKDRRVVDAANTIYSIKRLIGRSWHSDEVTKACSRFPFEMREGPGQAALVVARGETFTLPEISAFVLRHARAVAEKALGEPVDRAVVTVPASFNDLQRAATKVAGRVAGIEVLRILNEPTAAALAYGYGKGKGERIAIYDFGGGTFDVTLLDLSGNVFEVLATAGNTFLGGDDIDLALAEEMVRACEEQHGIDAHADPQIFERLRYYAEHLKMDLSLGDEAHIDVPDVGPGPAGKPLRLSFTMSRSLMDALAEPMVERTFDVCREALSIARLSPGDLDQVVLVGGSTRLPLVRARVEAFFGRRPLDRINPDEVVAIGAAIQASALSGGDRRKSVIPRPPMPAARTYDESAASAAKKSQPPPHPLTRGTDPMLLGRSPRTRPPLPRKTATELPAPGGRKRVTTGMGLGPSPGAASPGAPKNEAEVPTRVAWDLPLDDPPAADPLADFDSDDETTRVGPAREVLAPTLDLDEPLPSAPPPVAMPLPMESAAAPAPPMVARPSPAAARGATRGADLAALIASPGAFVPAQPDTRRLEIEAQLVSRPPLPLLVDVTPLSLSVETVGGYRDVIIPRNSPVPCEQARTFVTSQHDQTTVLVRVGQGEGDVFAGDTLLGQIELSGLRAAPRGAVHVVVTFALDTDGMLEVRAADAETGHTATAHLRLVGLPEAAEVAQMSERHARRGAR